MQLLRATATTLILFATLPLGEVHTFWAKDTTISNWIVARSVPMLTQWNVKLAVDQLTIIMYFVAWLFWQRNPVNVTTIKCFCLLSGIDTLLYFYNYKASGYGPVYLWFILFWVALVKNEDLARWSKSKIA